MTKNNNSNNCSSSECTAFGWGQTGGDSGKPCIRVYVCVCLSAYVRIQCGMAGISDDGDNDNDNNNDKDDDDDDESC